MRIIGGHDYYDGVVPFDADRSRVFLRDKREVNLGAPLPFTFAIEGYAHTKQWTHETERVEVIFCGKRYRGIRLVRHRRDLIRTAEPLMYFWSADKAREYIAFQKRPKHSWRTGRDHVFDDNLEGYFEPEDVSKELFDKLLAEKICVAIAPEQWRYRKPDDPWTVNSDGLKALHFGAVMEPWRAYQELEMFLGTILVGDEDRMVKVSDKTKLAKYGFDEWSFKHPVHPSKPRGHKAA